MYTSNTFNSQKLTRLIIKPCRSAENDSVVGFVVHRLGVHDGELDGSVRGSEGFALHAAAEGERHALCYFPVLRGGTRRRTAWASERLHQGEQQPHGFTCVEHVWTGRTQLEPGGAGHQHILAQLLPGQIHSHIHCQLN